MSSPKPITYSVHASTRVQTRQLDEVWIERIVRNPDWNTEDSGRSQVECRFGSVPERGGRILRVAVVETHEEIRIVTAFLDRRVRKPQ